MSRTHLRRRVLLLTFAFAFVLLAITFGLAWRARSAQERWTELIGGETSAVASLEELVRQQNSFRTLAISKADFDPERYKAVSQILRRSEFRSLDVSILATRVRSFESVLEATALDWPRSDVAARDELVRELTLASDRISNEADALARRRRSEINEQLLALKREARVMLWSGVAIAWIIVILTFAAVQTTLHKVVRPLEQLVSAANRITAGDITARAPVAGDFEIATLGVAFNRMADELRARARTDDLTALPNFRAFRERIDAEIERAARYPQAFGVLVLDLDRFKVYNDTYGHLAGNDALQRVAKVIRDSARSTDFPARYGGEEFAVITPESDARALLVLAERIRTGIEALPAPQGGAKVTVSIGAALYPADGATPESLFQVADARLYEAKHAGRNCVVGPSLAPKTATK